MSPCFKIYLFTHFFSDGPCLAKFSCKPKNVTIFHQHWVFILAVFWQMFRYVDHSQEYYLLIPVPFNIFIIYHLFKQPRLLTWIPFNEPFSLFYLFEYFTQVHHFFMVLPVAYEFRVIFFDFHEFLFIFKSCVKISCISLDNIICIALGYIKNIHFKSGYDVIFIVKVNLEHENEFILGKLFSISKHVVELLE